MQLKVLTEFKCFYYTSKLYNKHTHLRTVKLTMGTKRRVPAYYIAARQLLEHKWDTNKNELSHSFQ
jgi:hypothetical protein